MGSEKGCPASVLRLHGIRAEVEQLPALGRTAFFIGWARVKVFSINNRNLTIKTPLANII